MIGIPSNETIWVTITDDLGDEYVITSKVTRDVYYLYRLEKDKVVKLGKNENPLELEKIIQEAMTMYNNNNFEELISTIKDENVARIFGNILGHIDDFVVRHGDDFIGCEEEYMTSYNDIMEDAATTFGKVLYELQEYIA